MKGIPNPTVAAAAADCSRLRRVSIVVVIASSPWLHRLAGANASAFRRSVFIRRTIRREDLRGKKIQVDARSLAVGLVHPLQRGPPVAPTFMRKTCRASDPIGRNFRDCSAHLGADDTVVVTALDLLNRIDVINKAGAPEAVAI